MHGRNSICGLCQSIFLCLGVPRGPRLFWSQPLMYCPGNTNKPMCRQAVAQQEVPLLTAAVGNAFPKLHLSLHREERLVRGNVSRNGIWACSESIPHAVLSSPHSTAAGSEVAHSVSGCLLSSPQSQQQQKTTPAELPPLLALEEMTLIRQRECRLHPCYWKAAPEGGPEGSLTCSREGMKDLFPSVSSSEFSYLIN